MISAIADGMVITIAGKKYTVVSIDAAENKPNTRKSFDTMGVKDMIIVQRGAKFYSVYRYTDSTLGALMGY